MFMYYRLFDVLQRRGLKVKDLMLMTGLTDPTMAKLRKGASVNTSVLVKICAALNVQPADIMEYIQAPDQAAAGEDQKE